MPGLPFTPENVAKFDAFIESLGLKHFQPYELRIHCEDKRNGLPPEKLWKNIGSTARLLDEFREEVKLPIFINSVFRSKEYNKAIGGATASNHKEFCAIDFWVRGLPVTPTLRARFDTFVKQKIASGQIKRAGRGYYPKLGFMHIDTNQDNGARPLGKLTTWNE